VKVGIFYNSITNQVKSPHKVNLMDVFKAGVLANGDEVVEYRTPGGEPAQDLDAGFILGYSLADNHRGRTIKALERNRAYRIFVDSNILNYARPEHQWHRYSMNSVYPDTGIYFYGNTLGSKWNEFSSWHGTTLKPWRTQGTHILVLGQRPHGWNMFSNQDEWLDQTITKIRQYCDRPIRIRMHPGDGNKQDTYKRLKEKFGTSITISTQTNIRDDLIDCWCTVGYNSTPNAVALIEGVPAYIQDPTHSWATGPAFTNLEQITNPPLPDRTDWADRIANIHWSNEEVRSGRLWSAMREYIVASR
jgi:hypothetical protein